RRERKKPRPIWVRGAACPRVSGLIDNGNVRSSDAADAMSLLSTDLGKAERATAGGVRALVIADIISVYGACGFVVAAQAGWTGIIEGNQAGGAVGKSARPAARGAGPRHRGRHLR